MRKGFACFVASLIQCYYAVASKRHDVLAPGNAICDNESYLSGGIDASTKTGQSIIPSNVLFVLDLRIL